VRALPAIVAAALLALAGGTGLLLSRAHGERGLPASPASVPLGGFEPVAVDLFYLRALNQIADQRLPEAIASIRVVTELQPRVAEGWALLGSLLAWRNSSSPAPEQWKFAREGLRLVERGIALNPDSVVLASAHADLLLLRVVEREDVRAEAERETGRPPEAAAREAFRRLLALRPSGHARTGYAESSRLLGERLLARGDARGAEEAFRAALPIFAQIAEDPEAAPARERVASIEARLRELSPR
jgi:hypothetical protein